jgi:CRP/FNR family transcriptional regulator
MGETDIFDLSVAWERHDEGNPDLLDAIPTELIDEGDALYNQGNAPVEFSLIRHGKMEVAKQAPDGSRSILAILGPGEPVGLMAVINGFDYPATVKALEDTIVYRITADLVPELEEAAPRWWSECIGGAARRISDLADRLESINTEEIAQRLSKQICKLAEEHGTTENGHLRIDMKLTRQMLADMIGCRVESAIRTMSQWEKKGIIRTEESLVTIRQPGKLYSLAGLEPPEDL